MKRIAAISLLCLTMTIAGCASYSTQTKGPKIDNYIASEIETGVTTRAWVIEKLGKPSRTEFIGSDEILIYEYTEKRTPTYLSGTVALGTNVTITRNVLDLTIKNDIVTSYRFRSSVTK